MKWLALIRWWRHTHDRMRLLIQCLGCKGVDAALREVVAKSNLPPAAGQITLAASAWLDI